MTINRRQFLTGVLGGSAAAGLVRFSGMGSLLSMAEASASTVPKNGPFVLVTLYRWQRRAQYGHPVQQRYLLRLAGRTGHPCRTGAPPRQRRGTRVRLPPFAHHAGGPLEAGQGRHHQRCRVPQPQLQPLPVDLHLADRPAVGRPEHRLAWTLARCHRGPTRSGPCLSARTCRPCWSGPSSRPALWSTRHRLALSSQGRTRSSAAPTTSS